MCVCVSVCVKACNRLLYVSGVCVCVKAYNGLLYASGVCVCVCVCV